jgi:hypothetical protein
LVLAEQVHLASTAIATALLPWAQGHGFALFGKPGEDQNLLESVRKMDQPPAFLVSAIVDATGETWGLSLRLLRVSDAVCLASVEQRAPMNDPAPGVEELCISFMRKLTEHARIEGTAPPSWYRRPQGSEGSDYLLRLEQQLSVESSGLSFLEGGAIFGEHEILEGALQLCVRNPDNATTRMLYAQTLRGMKKVRSEIPSQYKERTVLLQRDHPIAGHLGTLIEKAISEALTA